MTLYNKLVARFMLEACRYMSRRDHPSDSLLIDDLVTLRDSLNKRVSTMTIELTANCDPVPLSYEGFPLRFDIAYYDGICDGHCACTQNFVSSTCITTPGYVLDIDNLRVVSPDEFFDWRKH